MRKSREHTLALGDPTSDFLAMRRRVLAAAFDPGLDEAMVVEVSDASPAVFLTRGTGGEQHPPETKCGPLFVLEKK